MAAASARLSASRSGADAISVAVGEGAGDAHREDAGGLRHHDVLGAVADVGRRGRLHAQAAQRQQQAFGMGLALAVVAMAHEGAEGGPQPVGLDLAADPAPVAAGDHAQQEPPRPQAGQGFHRLRHQRRVPGCV